MREGDFRDGPLEDGRSPQVHSLVVYMAGDGMHSIGYYRQVYAGEGADVPLGCFEWVPTDE